MSFVVFNFGMILNLYVCDKFKRHEEHISKVMWWKTCYF